MTLGDLLGARNTNPLKLAPMKKGELLENAGLCPTDPRKCLESHWKPQVLSQSLWGPLYIIPSSL